MKPLIMTMADLVEHLLDDSDGGREVQELRQVRGAIGAAYRQLPADREWNCLRRRGRITTVAAQATGTVTYDHTGGTYERQLTLAGATWPEWAPQGVVLIGQVRYEIVDVHSPTVATLSINSNPGADITTPTAYSLVQDTYPLPTDFGAMAGLVDLTGNFSPCCVTDDAWLEMQRLGASSGRPQVYTIMGSPDYLGQKAIAFAPAPATAINFEYVYRRYPRPMQIERYTKGTVTATSGSATIVGTGTGWTSDHVGTVIRFSEGTAQPDTAFGESPLEIERVVLSIDVGAQEATVDAVMPKALSGVNYRMSDPLDLDLNVMLTPFLRLCEAQQGMLRIWKSGAKEEDRQERRVERRRRMEEYYAALRTAAAADNASYEVTSPLEGAYGGPLRLRDLHSSPGGIGNG